MSRNSDNPYRSVLIAAVLIAAHLFLLHAVGNKCNVQLSKTFPYHALKIAIVKGHKLTNI